jgi:hypothetical protein
MKKIVMVVATAAGLSACAQGGDDVFAPQNRPVQGVSDVKVAEEVQRDQLASLFGAAPITAIGATVQGRAANFGVNAAARSVSFYEDGYSGYGEIRAQGDGGFVMALLQIGGDLRSLKVGEPVHTAGQYYGEYDAEGDVADVSIGATECSGSVENQWDVDAPASETIVEVGEVDVGSPDAEVGAVAQLNITANWSAEQFGGVAHTLKMSLPLRQ